MTEILFYHLQHQPLERVLPTLLEKSLTRGWRIVVQAASDERVEALDAHLWTYRDDGFLPHGTYRESEAASQPVLLTVQDHNPNRADVRFLIEGAPLPEDADAYQRVCSCSTERMKMPSPGRAKTGAPQRRPATPSPIGSRTSTGAGSRKRDRRV
jgi:DNA polymerase-3 subunit chi